MEGEILSLDARWRKICSETLTLVCRNKDAWIFKDPVIESKELSHDAKVAYSAMIPNPMDFGTIRKNMAAFESPTDFEADMLLVFRNCYTFNRPGQDAYEMGKDVENVFLSKWELERRKEIANSIYQKSVELATSANSDILITSRRKAKKPPPFYDAINRKVVHEPSSSGSASSGSSDAWKEIVKRFFKEIRADPQMNWFQKPVFKYPEIPFEVKKHYYTIIRQPMDFETIKMNLDIYPSPSEFRRDLELIVTNSVRFNPPGSLVNAAALDLQNRINKIFQDPVLLTAASSLAKDWIAKRIPPENPPSDLVITPAPGTVLRLKRTRTTDLPKDETEVHETETVKAVIPSPPVERKAAVAPPSQIMSIDRPMTPAPINAVDWKQFANHLLTELQAIKDENGTKLSWIFQRPIFKYDLPANIKRLYLLSITELMDIGLIQARLGNGDYDRAKGPESFESDVELMLDNCLIFNDETQYPHKVAFVIQKHYNKYWRSDGLRGKALGLWTGSHTQTIKMKEGENPDWTEIRASAASNDIVKDCDSVSSNFPLNDELLYEWRVSQRHVLHYLKKARA
jgi:hypothetical protein